MFRILNNKLLKSVILKNVGTRIYTLDYLQYVYRVVELTGVEIFIYVKTNPLYK